MKVDLVLGQICRPKVFKLTKSMSAPDQIGLRIYRSCWFVSSPYPGSPYPDSVRILSYGFSVSWFSRPQSVTSNTSASNLSQTREGISKVPERHSCPKNWVYPPMKNVVHAQNFGGNNKVKIGSLHFKQVLVTAEALYCIWHSLILHISLFTLACLFISPNTHTTTL